VKDEGIYLGHIRHAIGDIKAYAAVGEEAFLADRMRQDAIIRKLEIIGEKKKKSMPVFVIDDIDRPSEN
jgi:uncharacterized protein with HEPN domain